MKGFNHKTLVVDLSARTVTVEQPHEADYRFFLGGTGFIAHMLLKGIPPGIDP
jgi:aldehyde:ferredoxin oxidoreductase